MNALPKISAPAAVESLFTPFQLGPSMRLKNRIILAPCTRNRSELDFTPTRSAIRHYASRAAAGLLITEGVVVAQEARGGPALPGIYTQAHVDRWSEVTAAVHAKGGLIFSQLWHLGRMAHSFYSGTRALAPSAVLDDAPRHGERYYDFRHEMPVAMTDGQVRDAIAAFQMAARRAREAGFDGIELHAANGYLFDQFLKQHTNRRTDAWGGTAEKRARFLKEVFDACAAEIGAERIGVRLSPADYMSEMVHTDGDEDALRIALAHIERHKGAYVHTGAEDDVFCSYLGMTPTEFLRRNFAGTVIANGGYTPEAAAQGIEARKADLYSFGRLFLANPDLVEKLFAGEPLRPYARAVYDTMR